MSSTTHERIPALDGRFNGARQSYSLAFACVAGLFALVNIWMAFAQKPMTVLMHVGWDIETYIAIVQQLDAGQHLHHAAPFVYRFGSGALASLIPFGSIFERYLIVGLLSNIITVSLLVWWLKKRAIKPWYIFAAASMFILAWHSPVRTIYYAPQSPDPAFMAIFMSGVALMELMKRSITGASIVTFSLLTIAGVCVRETSLLLPIALLFVANPIKGSFRFSIPNWKAFIPLVCGILTYVVIHTVITQNNDYDFANAGLMWLYNKPFVMYLQGLLLSFGPILILLILYFSKIRGILHQNQHLAFLTITVFAFSWFGGTDTERIVFWCAPIVIYLVASLFESPELRTPLVLGLLFAGQVLVLRPLWLTPDIIAPNPFVLPILAVQGSDVQHPHLRAWHNDRRITLLSAIELFAYSLTIWAVVSRLRAQFSTSSQRA